MSGRKPEKERKGAELINQIESGGRIELPQNTAASASTCNTTKLLRAVKLNYFFKAMDFCCSCMYRSVRPYLLLS